MIAASFMFLSHGRGINGIYEAYITTYSIMLVALFVMTREEQALDFSFSELKGMLKFGVPYIPVLFFSWVIDFSDRYFLGHLATLQQVGLYSIGYKLGQVLYLAEKTFLIAWVPLMLSMHNQHKEKAPQIFGGIFTYFVLFIFLLFLAVSIFSAELIKIFASPLYCDAAAVVPWIALAYLLSGIYIYMISGFIIVKNVVLQPIILASAALANVVLNILLIPRFGMMGAAYATVFSYFIAASFTAFFAQRLYPIKIEWLRLIKIAACCMAVYFLSVFLPKVNLALSIVLKSIMVAAFFTCLALAGFFSPDEIEGLKTILSRKRQVSA